MSKEEKEVNLSKTNQNVRNMVRAINAYFTMMEFPIQEREYPFDRTEPSYECFVGSHKHNGLIGGVDMGRIMIYRIRNKAVEYPKNKNDEIQKKNTLVKVQNILGAPIKNYKKIEPEKEYTMEMTIMYSNRFSPTVDKLDIQSKLEITFPIDIESDLMYVYEWVVDIFTKVIDHEAYFNLTSLPDRFKKDRE